MAHPKLNPERRNKIHRKWKSSSWWHNNNNYYYCKNTGLKSTKLETQTAEANMCRKMSGNMWKKRADKIEQLKNSNLRHTIIKLNNRVQKTIHEVKEKKLLQRENARCRYKCGFNIKTRMWYSFIEMHQRSAAPNAFFSHWKAPNSYACPWGPFVTLCHIFTFIFISCSRYHI